MGCIEIKDLRKSFTYEGKVTEAVRGVSLSIEKGEIFGLLGPNGAGKTTIISILIGLLERDSGKVSLLGMDLDKDIEKIKARTNIVTGFTMLGMRLSVREYLNYFAMIYDIKDKEKNINGLIKDLGLSSKEDIPINDLSSGYKQRVLLAKSLINDPEIIYMDEPTVGLDVGVAIKVRNIVSNLKKKGVTIIFTSHNLNEVEELCDRVALLSNGKIVQMGSIDEIKQRIRNNKVIEVVCNDTKGLAAIIRKMDEAKSVNVAGDAIIIEAKTDKGVDKIMKKCMDTEFMILSVRRIEPTLEEAFLKIIEEEQ